MNMKNRYFPILCLLISAVLLSFAGCVSFGPKDTPPVVVAPDPIPEPQINTYPEISKEIKMHCGSRPWKYIVIHHSASKSGNAADFDKEHREVRGWNRGLGYHFVIGNGKGSGNGKVEVGSRWARQIDGAHAGVKEYNKFGIGICLVGNFEDRIPSERQMSSLISLVNFFQEQYNIPSENVILHKHVRETACPGRNFPYFDVLSNIKAF